jgi:hypothetical protein
MNEVKVENMTHEHAARHWSMIARKLKDENTQLEKDIYEYINDSLGRDLEEQRLTEALTTAVSRIEVLQRIVSGSAEGERRMRFTVEWELRKHLQQFEITYTDAVYLSEALDIAKARLSEPEVTNITITKVEDEG